MESTIPPCSTELSNADQIANDSQQSSSKPTTDLLDNSTTKSNNNNSTIDNQSTHHVAATTEANNNSVPLATTYGIIVVEQDRPANSHGFTVRIVDVPLLSRFSRPCHGIAPFWP